jgi:hypothetical protein
LGFAVGGAERHRLLDRALHRRDDDDAERGPTILHVVSFLLNLFSDLFAA